MSTDIPPWPTQTKILAKLLKLERSFAGPGLQSEKNIHIHNIYKSKCTKNYRKRQKPLFYGCFNDEFITEVGKFPDPSFFLARPSIFPETGAHKGIKTTIQRKGKN